MAFADFLFLYKLPVEARKDVIRHYLNKISGKPGTNTEKTAKNLLKLAGKVSHFKVYKLSDKEAELCLYEEPEIIACARTYPSSDLATLREIWVDKEYAPCIRILRNLKTNGPLIVDVGSNAGFAALYFAAFIPDAQFICIEPDEANFNQLKKNLAVNHIKPILLIQGALYPTSCRLEIKSDYRQGTHASYYVAENPDGIIQGYTFEEILSGCTQPVDLLKVDIEGTESLLFENAGTASAILKKIRSIAIEIHDDKADRDKIVGNLVAHGFSVFKQGETTFGVKH